jgi:hypothetical protein
MWRGTNKEIPIKEEEEKQRIVVGLKRSRHIIFVELSLRRRLFGI